MLIWIYALTHWIAVMIDPWPISNRRQAAGYYIACAKSGQASQVINAARHLMAVIDRWRQVFRGRRKRLMRRLGL